MTFIDWWWFMLTNEGNGSITTMSFVALATAATPAALIWLVARLVTGRWVA